jgi:2-polyprenyl-3-methyl-5-hydroxy-6-metoxy-1,4-benzoquinol methylase
MPMTTKRPIQGWAQKKRLQFFKEHFRVGSKILEVGSGSGWLKPELVAIGINDYIGIDVNPPADIVGDINKWQSLGLSADTFDIIIAFEVVEHVDCFSSCHALLKPGGKMLVTTPLPQTDWILKITEAFGVNQKRTSPHDHLIDLKTVSIFPCKQISIVLGLGQWAVLQKST